MKTKNQHVTRFVQQKELLVAGATTATAYVHLQQNFSSSGGWPACDTYTTALIVLLWSRPHPRQTMDARIPVLM